MRYLEIGGTPIGLALAVAILAFVQAQSSTGQVAGGEAPALPSISVGQAEAQLARANLAGEVEAVLGDAFGGAWFVPSTRQLHVGVVSSADGQLAEAAAARAGIPELLAVTEVNASWQQLEAVQADWNRRVADLLERGEATTSLVPERNAAKVELASTVPGSRLAALRRGAAAAGNVEVVVSPRRSFAGTKAVEQCKKWVKFKAYCDPTIVGGVTLEGEKVVNRTNCTTGPAVRLKDRTTKENATRTYILTAGHCIAKGGGEGKKWFAYNKADEEKEIGLAGPYINNKIDIGVIDVKDTYWAKANDATPVEPTTAFWSAGAESNPTAVSFEGKATKDTKTCLIGQRSMEVCGKIIDENVTTELSGETVEKLVKVQLEAGKKGGKGDSGGTMRAQESVSTVEGVYIGFTYENEDAKTESEGNIIYFHSLKTAFTELEAQKNIGLELLRGANKKRVHPSVTAGKYPATVTASDNSSAERFTAFGSSIECTERQFEGTLSEAGATLELTPTYGGCTSGGGSWPAKVINNGCKYRLALEGEVAAGHFNAKFDVVCPEGKSGIELHVYSNHADSTAAKPMCTLTVPPQTGLETVTLTNSGESILVDSSSVAGLDTKVHSTSCSCPSEGTESETANGALDVDGGLTISATSGGGAVKLDIGGE